MQKTLITKLKQTFFTLGLLFTLILASVDAKANISKHHQIMAGFLLHLTSFTQWKNLESDNIKLCLFGHEPFKAYINEMIKRRPKNIKGQSIVLTHITAASETSLDKCQIIYLEPEQYSLLWQKITPHQNTLLVSQSENFLAQGGMINFVLKNKKVKMEVNLPAVNDANLKISSTLLKHAKIINGTSHEGYIQKVY